MLPFCDALPVDWLLSVVLRVGGRTVCIMVYVTFLLYAESTSWCVSDHCLHSNEILIKAAVSACRRPKSHWHRPSVRNTLIQYIKVVIQFYGAVSVAVA